MKQNDELKQPFFAKFLESHSAAKVGATENSRYPSFTFKFVDDIVTHKYPSDNDENPAS